MSILNFFPLSQVVSESPATLKAFTLKKAQFSLLEKKKKLLVDGKFNIGNTKFPWL